MLAKCSSSKNVQSRLHVKLIKVNVSSNLFQPWELINYVTSEEEPNLFGPTEEISFGKF
jgi:hypothetical protein